jgi:hypothetical protein
MGNKEGGLDALISINWWEVITSYKVALKKNMSPLLLKSSLMCTIHMIRITGDKSQVTALKKMRAGQAINRGVSLTFRVKMRQDKVI